MCVNFRPPDPALLEAVMGVVIDLHDSGFWRGETWKDYPAPIVRRGSSGQREGLLASYGMVPRQRIPAGVRPFDTMNARIETVGQLRSFSSAWQHSQLCLVPMTAFYEPNYESGKAVRWGIGAADGSLLAAAGLWRAWQGEQGPEYSFTQLTMNADEHPLMRRFHRAGEEKRALILLPQEEWDDWLDCRNPEYARSFVRPYPAELLSAWAEPVPARSKAPAVTPQPEATQGNLQLDF
ncbi:SOS response-associated peptidase family protein [Duganella fentianensis]|uniref:SOS response-associated peptidase n=1 Tax=Duganella fentianensis TaxID=2692177 RepID=UPI0032B1DDE2